MVVATAAIATPQSLAQGDSYINSWAGVRGVNYVPSFSANPVQTWTDYNETTVERELGFAQGIGLNAVRVFLHMFVWYANEAAFLTRYDHLVAACSARGIKPLVVLFDDDFFDVKGVNTTADIKPWLATAEYKTSKWMANPGMFILKGDAANGWALANAYLLDILGGSRAHDSRILGYDVMNEPSRTGLWAGGLPAFISHAFERIGNLTSVPYTIDQYGQIPKDTENVEPGLSWHNYWHYGHWQSCQAQAGTICHQQQAAGQKIYADGEMRNKPVLVSEMGQFDCYCPAGQGWQNAKVGFIMWELMLEHDQFSSFQGLVYKNGTFRSATERDCLKELATTASQPKPCPPPSPPVPPAPPSPLPLFCQVSNCTFHRDRDLSFFSWTPSNNPTGHCWKPWLGGAGTAGSLHYCDLKGSIAKFTIPPSTKAATLVFKKGPDCGEFRITTSQSTTNTTAATTAASQVVSVEVIDSFANVVDWGATVSIELGTMAKRVTWPTQVTVEVLGKKRAASSHDWVQLVGVAVFH